MTGLDHTGHDGVGADGSASSRANVRVMT